MDNCSIFDLLMKDRATVIQRFIDRRGFDEMLDMYRDCITRENESINPEIVSFNFDEIGFEIRCAILSAQAKIVEAQEPVRALYWEYDGIEGQIFFCRSYYRSNSWASDFFDSIDAPGLPLIGEDRFSDMDCRGYFLLLWWAEANMIAHIYRVAKELDVSVPIGFAEHGNSMVRIRPRTGKRQRRGVLSEVRGPDGLA